MPRPLTPAVVTAIESAYVKPAILVQITLLTGPLYIWNGVGPLSWSGATFQGVGQFGNISSIEEGSNVQARGITLTLSGFDPSLINDALNEYISHTGSALFACPPGQRVGQSWADALSA